MVYNIRHKGFWEYTAGKGFFDQNFHSFIKYINPPKGQTLFITKKNASYFPFRYLHVYRTLKRAGNQFLQGNEYFQNVFTLALRTWYQKVPPELFKRQGGYDMLVHKGERHWELMTYNQHPLQHDFYELANHFCQAHHGEKSAEDEQRQKEFFENVQARCEEKKKKLGLEKHETLHLNDVQECFDEEMKRVRQDKGSMYYVKPEAEISEEEEKLNPKRAAYFY